MRGDFFIDAYYDSWRLITVILLTGKRCFGDKNIFITPDKIDFPHFVSLIFIIHLSTYLHPRNKKNLSIKGTK